VRKACFARRDEATLQDKRAAHAPCATAVATVPGPSGLPRDGRTSAPRAKKLPVPRFGRELPCAFPRFNNATTLTAIVSSGTVNGIPAVAHRRREGTILHCSRFAARRSTAS